MSIIGDLTYLKTLGRITSSAEDAELQKLLDDAEDWVARKCNVRFVANDGVTETDERLDGGSSTLFPCKLPVREIVALKDAWSDDEDVTADYDLFNTETQIRFDDFGIFPEGRFRWKLTYKYGYTAAEAPKAFRTVIHQLALRMYNNPDFKASEGSLDVDADFQNLAQASDLKALLEPLSFYRVVE